MTATPITERACRNCAYYRLDKRDDRLVLGHYCEHPRRVERWNAWGMSVKCDTLPAWCPAWEEMEDTK